MRYAIGPLALMMASGSAGAGELDMSRVRRDTNYLCDRIGPRPANGPAAHAAARYIERELARHGLEVRRLPVGTVVSPEVRAFGRLIIARQTHRVRDPNLVLRVAGSRPGPAILVMAHYDTVARSPGAVDNAASVALLMEVARYLTRHPPRRPLVLAWTASEETGLAGARALYRDLGSEIGLAVSLDLLGGANEVTLNGLSRRIGTPWLRWILSAARRASVVVAAPLLNRVVSRLLPQLERSDHGAFTERGIAALHLYSRGARRIYLPYHRASDTAARVRWGAVAAAGRLILAFADHDPLPPSGGDGGVVLSLFGPGILPGWLLLILEAFMLCVAALAIAHLVRSRHRRRSRKGLGLIAFVLVWGLAWLGATAILKAIQAFTSHPAPWLHRPLPFTLLTVLIAGALATLLSMVTVRAVSFRGQGRFLGVAIAIELCLAAGLLGLEAPELAAQPSALAACFGAVALARRPSIAALAYALSFVPLLPFLAPGFLREATTHGFVPVGLPLTVVLGVLLLPHGLAFVTLWLRFAPPLPRRGRGVWAAIAASAVAAALTFGLSVLLDLPCTGREFRRQRLACETRMLALRPGSWSDSSSRQADPAEQRPR